MYAICDGRKSIDRVYKLMISSIKEKISKDEFERLNPESDDWFDIINESYKSYKSYKNDPVKWIHSLQRYIIFELSAA